MILQSKIIKGTKNARLDTTIINLTPYKRVFLIFLIKQRNYSGLIFVHSQKAKFEIEIKSYEKKLKNRKISKLNRILKHNLNVLTFEISVLVGHF